MDTTETQLRGIRLLVLDVDGVMTDGRVILGNDGEEYKNFHVRDGSGVKYWLRAGRKIAWITGRQSRLVERRAEELGVEVVHQNCKHKLPAFEAVLSHFSLEAKDTAVVGDDLADLPLILRCGYAAAPADAVDEVKRHVHYLCRQPGGHGCVREVVERILRAQEAWEPLLDRYYKGMETRRRAE